MNKLGRLFSTIIFQNIAAIIAIGIIKSLFGAYGWFPNEEIYSLVDPMYNLLLPLLIGYTGGRVIGGKKAGVVAAIVVLGLIVSSPVSMLIGAMIIGPLVGWISKKVEDITNDYLPIGLELLIGNVIGAMIAVTFMIVSFYYIGPSFTNVVYLINRFIESVGSSGWLPLLAFIIEPGKVFFLNNIMNHGILSPIGMQQAKELGKSIFFLVESNPGPGLGMLVAYLLRFSQKKDKNAVKAAIGIQAIGGIHEVYFPYVLMKPILLLPVIAGGTCGIAFFQFTNVGLVTTPSPGSIFLLVVLAPKMDMFFVFGGILISAAVSFSIAFFLLKNVDLTLPQANENMTENQPMKNKEKPSASAESSFTNKTIGKIIFACDAGMGSSATGAALLKRRAKEANLQVTINHAAVDEIPKGTDMVVTHKNLKQRAHKAAPNSIVVALDTFTDMNVYDELMITIKSHMEEKPVIKEEQLMLDCKVSSKVEAIKMIGKRMEELGFVTSDYIDEMLKRESLMSTYIGNGVALPHGLNSKSTKIITPGIVIAQFQEGIQYDHEIAYILIGIAGAGDQQVRILSSIATLVDNKDEIQFLINTREKGKFLSFLSKVEMM
ncbi:PTS sugar transporter subunit IIA [Halalkalibacter lacteus]|uniref:PTS sugar transporter subunit IIA n=1 Tax=Halalkalibacter lacteus TaxID=3090663 RepID=UPI002FCB1885